MTRRIWVCDKHGDYLVPMMHTFAFMGAELWCPFCGDTAGFPFGAEAVDETPELRKRHDLYRKAVDRSEYLHAMGVRVCASTEWPRGSGKQVPPDELPDEEKQRLAVIRQNGWTFSQRAEDLR